MNFTEDDKRRLFFIAMAILGIVATLLIDSCTLL